jgi:hypothetical protein
LACDGLNKEFILTFQSRKSMQFIDQSVRRTSASEELLLIRAIAQGVAGFQPRRPVHNGGVAHVKFGAWNSDNGADWPLDFRDIIILTKHRTHLLTAADSDEAGSAAAFLSYISEVSSSNLGRDTYYPARFFVTFFCSLHQYACIVP